MVRETEQSPPVLSRRGLIVGNYCHDILIKDDVEIAKSLGGAVSFISVVLDGLSVPSTYVSKVGSDFAYAVSHDPIVSPTSPTTLFKAHFSSEPAEFKRQDRVLKRVQACEPVRPSDLPNERFDFGMAVGVAGEVLPETLERMLDLCNIVFVDIQALIRVFDPEDGTVDLIRLKETGFFHLLPRIGFLKASAEEALFIDVEEARKWCCVVVTNGAEGCTVYWKDGEMQISPFPTVQVDPTGAGDSFLGGLVAGLFQGLPVPDAALLGNFFGSLTVGHVGLPSFDPILLKRIYYEVEKRKLQCSNLIHNLDKDLKFMKQLGHSQFQASLVAAKLVSSCDGQECRQDLMSSSLALEQDNHHRISGPCYYMQMALSCNEMRKAIVHSFVGNQIVQLQSSIVRPVSAIVDELRDLRSIQPEIMLFYLGISGYTKKKLGCSHNLELKL